MFDLAWIENELAGLIISLHRIEGMIEVLQQMKAQAEAAQVAPVPTLSLEQLQEMLPPGHQIIGEVQRHEDQINS